MIAHVSLPVSDSKKAKEFYSAVLRPLGYEMTMDFDDAAGFMEGGQTSFWIAKKDKVEPGHIAFEAENKEAVEEFHKEAIARGGKDNGKPGYRKEYWPGYYAAFIHDMDGHNIEAVYYDYSETK